MTKAEKSLLSAVKRWIGDNWDYNLRVAYEQGMSGGIAHFTEMHDNVAFYNKHRTLILRFIAECYGWDPSPAFSELEPTFGEAECMRVLYGVSNNGDYSDYIKDNVVKGIVCEMAALLYDTED